MKILQRIVIILFTVVLITFCAVKANDMLFADHTPPVIIFESDTITASVKDTDEVLLRGITARDNHDGDITEKVMVKSVTGLITSDTAKVTYAVFDSSNNIATAVRFVQYTDYKKPTFILKQPLVYRVGSSIKLLDKLKAEDVVDGDISDSICVTVQNLTVDYPGTYDVTVQVTNSMGDTSILPLKIVINNLSAGNRVITLKDYIVYVEQNADFMPEEYIASFKSKKIDSTNLDQIEIDSNVDTAIPGNYEVSYTYSSENESYTAYLAVVVE